MKNIANSVQKQIGLMISIIGFIALSKNIIEIIIIGENILQNLSSLSVMILFLTLIPFVFSVFIENRYLKGLQIVVLLLTGIINIMESYNTVYGPGMFFAAWLLIRHYGFFDNHRKIKYSIFLSSLVILSQISAIIHNQGAIDSGYEILIYTSFIIMFVIIIWHDMVREQSRLKVENKSLRINYTKIRNQIIELEEEQKPYKLKSVKITPAEERVIKILTIYKASNREIAERLNIAESTVKLHLYNIYNKIGVDNRFAIIELCKYNYT
jgi:DNA-binding CsgD family transcriptional regulator